MYLAGSVLGTDGSSEAPLPSSYTEFSDPIEASLVAQFAAFRQVSELDEERREFLSDAHSLFAGFLGGAAAGFFSSREERLKTAAIGGAIGGIAELAVLVFINIIRNSNRRT